MSAPNKSNESTSMAQHLDTLTGGAFTAPTSGERAQRIREWLAISPTPEQMQEVFKELQTRDKGAAKPLREKLDEIKRAKAQEAIAAEWAEKATALLALSRINIADALAWQRDAARAGAPLSREPLSELKVKLADRVKGIEDLQHRVQVQREAAVLLAQRIELLSTKPWRDAQGTVEVLQGDVAHWQDQAVQLQSDNSWASLDGKFPPLLESSKTQLLVVWDAFSAAVTQAATAAADAAAPLPPVPVWADELRVARGVPLETVVKAPKSQVEPEVRAKANEAIRAALAKLEQEVAEGHGKASAGAANALRNALKEFGRLVDDKLENQAHGALAAAGELEGWQRWRADQLREELVAKAESLLKRPDGQALGGRKMQETLRALRDQWKLTDQGGIPNHALWKRFDEACNLAHKVVEEWLEKVKADAAEHRTQRLALIDELKAWTQRNVERTEPHEWKAFNRAAHLFAERWREAGHVGEKVFAELQPLWKETFQAAMAPLESAQKASIALRHGMIEEAKTLGAAPELRIDAVKALQHRWQAEAQTVPLERKFEQKLWDTFRQPIDEAFNRKTLEREKAAAALSAHDQAVLVAAKGLELATASGDAQQIRAAMAALEAVSRGQALAAAHVQTTSAAENPGSTEKMIADEAHSISEEAENPSETGGADATPATVANPPVPQKPVVAVRGDDRPGMKKAEAAPVGGNRGKFGDRKEGRGDGRTGGRPDARDARGGHGADRPGGRFGDRPAFEDRGPRLGDTAFRAQRDALDHAQMALKKLAAMAHGEVLTQLLGAWESRDAQSLPTAQSLGRAVSAGVRGAWVQSLSQQVVADVSAAQQALLRLEMASEVPTPAEHMNARRALQLQLLTRRNDPSPALTWGQDAATVLASAHQADHARRLQAVLKALMR
jgi:ATP-dependent RNA helicase SUPV3L1/SUV3